MESPDPYLTLGVSASATETEIKRAYRKLARRFHPDVSKEPDAESRFKALATAYAAVGTAAAREAHDASVVQAAAEARYRAEAERQRERFGARGSGSAPGGDGFGNFGGFGGFEDLAGLHSFADKAGRGGGRRGPRGGRPSADPDADSDAQGESLLEALMARARGGGGGARVPENGPNTIASVQITLEEAFFGARRTLSLQTQLGGAAAPKERTLEVTIPKGVRPGQQLRLVGQGEPAPRGGSAGDLLLRLEFAPQDRYRIDGADLSFTLALAPWEAALGVELACATPGGELMLKVPAGCASGRRLRLKGRGLPSTQGGQGGLAAGDAFAEVQIVLPSADLPGGTAAYQALESAFAGFEARRKAV